MSAMRALRSTQLSCTGQLRSAHYLRYLAQRIVPLSIEVYTPLQLSCAGQLRSAHHLSSSPQRIAPLIIHKLPFQKLQTPAFMKFYGEKI